MVADQTDTYEAQMVRALRELDQALQLIRYELDKSATPAVLNDLRRQGLLPPEFLFDFSIVLADGSTAASTGAGLGRSVAQDLLARAAQRDGMVIGRPQRAGNDEQARLHFARATGRGNAGAAGVVVASVHAGYFVSGYETRALGQRGVLALAGADGIFRVRRTGERTTTGGRVGTTVAPQDNRAETVDVELNEWDQIERYTLVRKLFDYPASIVVGASRAEQFAPALERRRSYFQRASAASVVLLALVALLGRLSLRLQRAQELLVEERLAHAEQSEFLAFHDNLTGLPNREHFSRLLTHSMERARRGGGDLALLFLDVDRFKAINDSLGHDVGDELLQQVGERLRVSVRASDVVARLGGDEFVVLLPHIGSSVDVGTVAEKILATVGRPFTLADHEFRVTVSIGVTVFPADGEDEQTLIKNADVAMYHAKAQGKNNFQCYSEELNADTLERLALESSLRRALDHEEFRLFYQAKRRLDDGAITGMEALLRWQHPELGLVGPMKFIPLAEESGLIVAIGRWVLRRACDQNVAWQGAGWPALTVAVNLSARQFMDEQLLIDVHEALDASGMEPRLLELEITESMLMSDIERTTGILERLQALGVRIAIDDFGTGYSSLATLKQFPLDAIKLDRAFIRGIAESSTDRCVSHAAIRVGKCLGLTVVAEGVETDEQAEHLRAHRCDEFQGFLSDRPVQAEEFAQFMRTQLTKK